MFRRPKRPSHSIDMAPLIDVVFLLLVFFMLTSSFSPPGLALTLPKAKPTGETPKPAPVISLDAAGQLALNGEILADEALEARVRELLSQEGGKTVHFRGDRASDYGRTLDVMAKARSAGAVNIHLIHEPAPAP